MLWVLKWFETKILAWRGLKRCILKYLKRTLHFVLLDDEGQDSADVSE